MTDHNFDDDRELRDLLRSVAPAAPVDDVDWGALQARIAARARPRLRDTPAPAWWQLVAGWASRGIPLTATAAAATLVLLLSGVLEPRTEAAADTTFRSIEEELASGLGDDAPLLVAGADSDQVMDALLFYDEEGS